MPSEQLVSESTGEPHLGPVSELGDMSHTDKKTHRTAKYRSANNLQTERLSNVRLSPSPLWSSVIETLDIFYQADLKVVSV